MIFIHKISYFWSGKRTYSNIPPRRSSKPRRNRRVNSDNKTVPTFVFQFDGPGVAFLSLGCGGGSINSGKRRNNPTAILLRLPEFILPPPHPSVKERLPRGLSYDQIEHSTHTCFQLNTQHTPLTLESTAWGARKPSFRRSRLIDHHHHHHHQRYCLFKGVLK
jgi:hypothetical protein